MLIALTMVLCAALIGCISEKKNKLEGTWEMVSAKYGTRDTTYDYAKLPFHMVKIITKNHWAFLEQDSSRNKFNGGGTDAELLDAAKKFGAGGGTYTLEGDTYTEHIEFFLIPNLVGMSIPYKADVQGDRFIQSGTMPMKAAGLGNEDIQLYEVYKRIE
jgi:hypothetical protein